MNSSCKNSPSPSTMIELSTSWELQGRRKLSDVLIIKEVQLEETGSKTGVDLPTENQGLNDICKSSPITLQPYLHPELSPSPSACCILIRLSTLRHVRIAQIVIVSSSPHIDIVDRYGEPLSHVEGVCIKPGASGSTVAGLSLCHMYRCFSGRLSPHIECIVRFSEQPHVLDPLVIQHIGVFLSLPLSNEAFVDSVETHTQEIIKLSSFLGVSSGSSMGGMYGGGGGGLSSVSFSSPRSHSLFALSTPVAMRSKTSSPVPSFSPTIPDTPTPSIEALSSQFLTSTFTGKPPEFWKQYAISLFATLVRLSLGKDTEKSSGGDRAVSSGELECKFKCISNELVSKLQAYTPSDSPSISKNNQMLSGVSNLSSSMKNLEHMCEAHLNDFSDRVQRIELETSSLTNMDADGGLTDSDSTTHFTTEEIIQDKLNHKNDIN